jgi:hypothetical protein
MLLASGLYCLTKLEQSKFTGRYQLFLSPNSYKSSNLQHYKKSLLLYPKKSELSPLFKSTNQICSLLINSFGLNYNNFTLTILESNKTSATVLPDGSIVIHSGLFNKISNIDELAFIIAHELSHYILRHSEEKLGFRIVFDIFYFFLKVFLEVSHDQQENEEERKKRIENEEKPYFFEGFLGAMLEFEADRYSLIVLENSIFDPSVGIMVLMKFKTYHWIYNFLFRQKANPLKRFKRLQKLIRMERVYSESFQGDLETIDELKNREVFDGIGDGVTKEELQNEFLMALKSN